MTRQTKILMWGAMSGAFLFCLFSAMYHSVLGIPLAFIAYLYIVLSLVTFIMYWIDKTAAIKQQWRVPEFTLHGLELGGGWFGGFVAQQLLRHKTIKFNYQLTFWSIVALHIGFWSWTYFA